MGLFDFFKKNTQQQNNATSAGKKFTKKEIDELVLSSLNILCDDISTTNDVIKMLKSKGYDDRQALIITERAESLYKKHFAHKKPEINNNRGKSLNEIYAEKRTQNNGVLSLEKDPDEKFISQQFQHEMTALARTIYHENGQDMGMVKQSLLNKGLSGGQVDVVMTSISNLNGKMVSDFEQALSSGNITAEFIPNPAHHPGNADETQIDRYIGYGAFQLQYKNYDNALELLNKAIELGDKTGLAYANLGALHHELSNYEQSIENYDKAIKLNSKDARLYHNKALVLEDFGDKIGASENYKKTLQIDDRHMDALNNLGVLQISAGNYTGAVKCFNKVLVIEPTDKDALINKISTLIQLDLNEALQFYVSIKDVADLSEIESIIMQALLAKHTETNVISFLEGLYEASKEPKYIKLQSLILYDKNKSASYEAINIYLSLNPSDQFAIDFKVDLAFEVIETIGEAGFIEAVDECLALDDKNPTALNYKIQILLKQQKLGEALDGVEALFIPYYQQQNTLRLFTQVYNQLDKEMAMLRFEGFAKQLDDNARYQLDYMKGLYLKGKDDYDEAIVVFSCLNEEREFSWNYYQIAIIENLNGNIERCLLNLKKTFELEPELKEDARTYVELKNLASNVSFLSLLK